MVEKVLNSARLPKGLRFDKFRIYSTPGERVDKFVTFFDYFNRPVKTYSFVIRLPREHIPPLIDIIEAFPRVDV